MDGDRTFSLLADGLEQEAIEWRLSHTISAMTTDNGSNIVNVVVHHLEWPHVACAGHTLQVCRLPVLELQAISE